jgi:hypothetical protein
MLHPILTFLLSDRNDLSARECIAKLIIKSGTLTLVKSFDTAHARVKIQCLDLCC